MEKKIIAFELLILIVISIFFFLTNKPSFSPYIDYFYYFFAIFTIYIINYFLFIKKGMSSLLIIPYTFLLLSRYFFGYRYPRGGDYYSHLNFTNYIYFNHHFKNSDPYPFLHSLFSSTNLITSINNNWIFYFIFISIQIIILYLLLERIKKKKMHFSYIIVILPIISTYFWNPLPYLFALLFLILIFYKINIKNSLIILMYLALVFYHPLVAFFTLIMIFIEKRKIISSTIIIWIVWLIYNNILNVSINKIINLFSYNSPVTAYSANIEEAATHISIFEILLNIYIIQIYLVLLYSIIFFLLLKYYKINKKPLLIIVIASFAYIIYYFFDLLTGPDRILIIFSAFLIILFINYKIKEIKINKFIKIFLILLIITPHLLNFYKGDHNNTLPDFSYNEQIVGNNFYYSSRNNSEYLMIYNEFGNINIKNNIIDYKGKVLVNMSQYEIYNGDIIITEYDICVYKDVYQGIERYDFNLILNENNLIYSNGKYEIIKR